VGVFAGIGASFLFSYLLTRLFPTMVITITANWLARAAVFSILSGIIGSTYPALRAASRDPVEAIAYE
jgi:putative ABC transport system permease protein